MAILRDKVVITRKKHRCSACLRMFEPGTEMRTQVNTSDGLIVWRECPTCQILLSQYRSRFEDPDDDVCYGGCVEEVLNGGQTPEDLLFQISVGSVVTYRLKDPCK